MLDDLMNQSFFDADDFWRDLSPVYYALISPPKRRAMHAITSSIQHLHVITDYQPHPATSQ